MDGDGTRAQQAREFARNVRADFPDQMLAYNLSPSFNWDAPGVFNNDEEIEAFTDDLAKAGYGSSDSGWIPHERLSHESTCGAADVGMKANVEGVQRREGHRGLVLKHQTWSGAELMTACRPWPRAAAPDGVHGRRRHGRPVRGPVPGLRHYTNNEPLSRFEHRLMLEARAATKTVEPRTGAALWGKKKTDPLPPFPALCLPTQAVVPRVLYRGWRFPPAGRPRPG